MRLRTITTVVGLPLALLILLAAPKLCAAIIIGLLCAIGVYELLWRTEIVKYVRLVAYGCIAAFCVCIWSYLKLQYTFGVILILLFVMALFTEILLSKGKLRLEKAAVCFFAGFFVPYCVGAVIRILTFANGRFLVLIPCILAFLSDIGAYLVGCKFGKHKLAPEISPHKTIEGVLGSLGVSIGSMLIYCLVLQIGFQFQVNYLYAILYGVLGTAGGVFGDLMFSAIKRQVGIKDYGNLLPGHGGVMDRFDSMVIVAPLTEILVILLPVVVK